MELHITEDCFHQNDKSMRQPCGGVLGQLPLIVVMLFDQTASVNISDIFQLSTYI